LQYQASLLESQDKIEWGYILMAWNGSDNSNRQQQQAPPDLDVLIRKLRNKLKAALGNKGSNIGGGNFGAKWKGSNKNNGLWIFSGVATAIVVIWILSGIFIVSPAERAVILRFGKYAETVGPGPHWIPRLIESKYIVNVQRVDTFTYQSDMLTKDENIVSVTVSVQYRVANAHDYLFNIVDADASLQQATASALRQVVGHTTLDGVLTIERQQAREQMALQLQELLNRYKSGIVATDVTLQSVRPPEAVTAAFDDAVKAREDQQSYINQANAYRNQILANANGQVSRIMQEANASKQSVVLEAQGAIASYLALLPQYQKSPDLTRQRLYLATLESVLSNSSKVLVDMNANSSNMIYLPLDKIIPQNEKKAIEAEPKPKLGATLPDSATGFDDTASKTPNVVLERPVYPARGDMR
jgi:modulator of FtsH protease HflK